MSSLDSSSDELPIVLVFLSDGATSQTESLSMSKMGSTVHDLASLACALFGIGDDTNGSNNDIRLLKDGHVIYNPTIPSSGDQTLVQAGVVAGDMIAVAAPQQPQPSISQVPATSGTSTTFGAPGAGLDFSSLLSSNSTNRSNAVGSSMNNQGGVLTFSLPGLHSTGVQQQSEPVQWDGMHLDDVMERNTNPEHFIQVLFNTTRHPHLLKELNYHNPQVVTKLKQAYNSGGIQNNVKEAAKIWRMEIFQGTIRSQVSRSELEKKDRDFASRLRQNPSDVEAKAYFDEKRKREAVEKQYWQMMEEYPESMGRVLMLYVEAEVNGHAIQAFVDSGAQSTIMSKECAEKCQLLDLIDKRFEGVAVGVGTGKILGRIHIAQLKIQNHFFPCSITVMDSDGNGLGDKNMDFLLGLDMLKRHRCKIDLEINGLIFGHATATNDNLIAPFLHEKDLGVEKGGTKGFDAASANLELERARQEAMKKGEKSKDTDESMED